MREKTSNPTRFPVKHYLIFVLVLSALTVGIWLRFWTGLSDFEAGQPQNCMNRFASKLETIESEEEMADFLEASGYESQFQSAKEGAKALSKTSKGKQLSYSRKSGWQGEGEYAYSLLADGKEVAVVELVPTGKRLVMGLTAYKTSGVHGVGSFKVLAPPESEVKIGGVALGDSELAEKKIIPEALKKLSEFKDRKISIPSYVRYEIGGFFGEPEISATLPDGEGCVVIEVSEGEYLVGRSLSEDLKKEVEERITTITKKYSYYMSDDLGWTGFRGYIVKDSPLYDRLRTLEVYWYTLHDSTEFRDMEIEGMFKYSEDLIAVRIVYDYVVYGQGKITVYPTDLTYYLALDIDGKWRIAEMVVN